MSSKLTSDAERTVFSENTEAADDEAVIMDSSSQCW
jgi:hypothetical protein